MLCRNELIAEFDVLQPDRAGVICSQQSLLSVCGDGWFIMCTLVAQCTTSVQPQSLISVTRAEPGEAA